MKTGVGKAQTSRWVIILVAVMVVLVGYLGFAFFSSNVNVGKNRSHIQTATEMRAMVIQIPSLLARAGAGDAAAFGEVEALSQSIDQHWGRLRGASDAGIDAENLRAFDAVWRDIKKNVAVLVEGKDVALFVADVGNQLSANQSRLQEELSVVVEVLLARRTAANQVAMAQAQLWRAERLNGNIATLLLGGPEAAVAAEQFGRDTVLFERILAGFRGGDAALGITRLAAPEVLATLDNISQLFSPVSDAADRVTSSAPVLMGIRQARDTAFDALPALLEQTARLADNVRLLGSGQKLNSTQIAIYAGIFLIVGLALLGLIFYLGTRDRLKETAETNKANQDSILRLLDEIEGLGEGDLTVEVTVTEGFTGAIADAINLTIVQLRELVSRIVDTAAEVSSSANETRSTVLQLTGLSEHQAEEIAGASAAINEMAITIDQVSANAAESAAVADRSVSIANKGAEVVRSTISGMDSIREQIQDTSKRIKRLGESSQEIGDIVSLINDIADQTNILALNAAIQASMAGDAGRGFAVVADEVQRLAERSANATKQIAALVKTIQTDTNEAVSSMEQTTIEVVAGASLTENAGIALSEIETVSTNLAELIQDISTAARHQSTTAGHISKTMNVIQDITTQTLDGTNRTATSVGELAEIAIELRESVSGFKLPDQGLSRTSGVASDSFGSSVAPDHSTWLDDRFDATDGDDDVDVDELKIDLADLGEPSEIEMDIASEPSPHIRTMLEENSAAMDEIDYLSEVAATDDELAEMDTGSTVLKTSFAVDLEAELAGIDLDEFELELKDMATKRS